MCVYNFTCLTANGHNFCNYDPHVRKCNRVSVDVYNKQTWLDATLH